MAKKILTFPRIHLDTVIGIDPDVDRNGVAVLDCNDKRLEVTTLAFPKLLDYLLYQKRTSDACGKKLLIVIEAGWMNQGNWHLRYRDNRNVAVAKGVHQGRNEQVSRIIGQMCEHFGITYEFIKPLRKTWQGKDGKITHDELAYFTGLKGRTNQEGRDAALLAWIYAGFSVKVMPTNRK